MSTSIDPLKILVKRLGDRSQTELAQELGISKTYLGLLLVGKREFGPKVLDALGLQKIYVRKRSPPVKHGSHANL